MKNFPLWTSMGPVAVDGGVEWFEMTFADGTKLKAHLINLEVPAGEYYTSDTIGARFSSVLKRIEAGLPTACQ